MSRTIDVSDGINKIIKININKYLQGINSFASSYDALKICEALGVNDVNHRSTAAVSAIKFLNALRGKSTLQSECELLHYYKIGISPIYSNKFIKHFAYIKWILFINAQQKNIDNQYAIYIGIISGICLYFNELDLVNQHNNNKTNYYKNIMQYKYTENDV